MRVGTNEAQYFAHFPKDRNSEICQRTKITRAPCRRRIGRVELRSENFGNLITANHKVLSEESESRNNHRYAIVVVQELGTGQNKIFPGDPEELNEVPGADKETISHLH